VVPDVQKDHAGFNIEVKWHFYFNCQILQLQAPQSLRTPDTNHPTTVYNISENLNFQ
jgi:hypothetical protein